MMKVFSYCKEIIKLASPILSVRILYMAVSFIGMLLIAHLGEDELAAGALVTALTNTFMVICMSPLFAIGIIGSRYRGENKTVEIGELLRQAWLISIVLGVIGGGIFWYLSSLLSLLEQPPQLISVINAYFHGISWGLIPFFLLASCHQLFFTVRRGNLVVLCGVLNFVFTVLLGIALVFGYGYFPKLGMAGWSYAVSITNWFMLLLVFVYFYYNQSFEMYKLFDFKRKLNFLGLKIFFKISFPITVQFASELLAFSVINIMVGWIGVSDLSIQQILIQCSMLALMIPTGAGQACTILIGHAVGQNKKETIRGIGLTGAGLVTLSMIIIGLLYWLKPIMIISLYINPVLDPLLGNNQGFIDLAIFLLGFIAFSQIADGIRNIMIGGLRGLQDVWYPMWINIILLWGIGIPLAYILSFPLKQGLFGLNLGLFIAFALGAIFMLIRFIKKTSYL